MLLCTRPLHVLLFAPPLMGMVRFGPITCTRCRTCYRDRTRRLHTKARTIAHQRSVPVESSLKSNIILANRRTERRTQAQSSMLIRSCSKSPDSVVQFKIRTSSFYEAHWCRRRTQCRTKFGGFHLLTRFLHDRSHALLAPRHNNVSAASLASIICPRKWRSLFGNVI